MLCAIGRSKCRRSPLIRLALGPLGVMVGGLMSKTFRYALEVRGYELDSFGHVNHAVYLNYMEAARWKMLQEVGILHEQIVRDQLFPVITGIEIKYRRPAFAGDTLEVRSQVAEHGRFQFRLDQQIFKDETPIATAQVHSVIIDGRGRPVETPAAYHRLWG